MAEEAKKKARRVESELNALLSAYSKLVVAAGRESNERGTMSQSKDHAALERQIEGLLRDLTLVVDELYRYPEAAAQAQRARTVLSDVENDYRRNKSAMATHLVRSQLFTTHDSQGGHGLRPRDPATMSLLRENESIHTSIQMTNTVIEQAQAVRDRLHASNVGILAAMRQTLGQMGRRFPQVNALIVKIQAHRNRDWIVLSFVVAVCLLFTFFLLRR